MPYTCGDAEHKPIDVHILCIGLRQNAGDVCLQFSWHIILPFAAIPFCVLGIHCQMSIEPLLMQMWIFQNLKIYIHESDSSIAVGRVDCNVHNFGPCGNSPCQARVLSMLEMRCGAQRNWHNLETSCDEVLRSGFEPRDRLSRGSMPTFVGTVFSYK